MLKIECVRYSVRVYVRSKTEHNIKRLPRYVYGVL
jgi:hypothetical protein